VIPPKSDGGRPLGLGTDRFLTKILIQCSLFIICQLSLIFIKKTCILGTVGNVAKLRKIYSEGGAKFRTNFTKVLIRIWQWRYKYQIILPERSWMFKNHVSTVIRILIFCITILRLVAWVLNWKFYLNHYVNLWANIQAIFFISGYPILSI